jgi:putative membrane protein
LKRFLTHWLSIAIALGVATYIVPGVQMRSVLALAVGSLVLGFVNSWVRPVLVILTLPISFATLGLFLLVVNGIAFSIAAFLVPGFGVDWPVGAILGPIVVSIVSSLIGPDDDK